VLRLFREGEPDRARFEAAVQNALAEAGFPAPRAPLAADNASHLGGAFVVMRRCSGRMLGETIYELSEQGDIRTSVSLGLLRRYFEMLRLLTAAQARLHEMDPEPVLRAWERMGRPRDGRGFEGRIEWLRERVDQARLDGLRPGLAWLDERRPPPPARLSICHGDFNPNNLLVEDGELRGVLDWTHATIADPAFDVAAMLMAFTTVPVSMPRWLGPMGRLGQRACGRAYLRSYEQYRRLDREALRCLEVFAYRGVHQREGSDIPDAWNGPEGESNLLGRTRRLTGLSLEMPSI
jgi:aminoglycoside phosphotransferase (APT) family kinase protein